MQTLIQEPQHYQAKQFASQSELFERLSQVQSPEALFITCPDSRINQNLLPQTEPGEQFILCKASTSLLFFSVQDEEADTIEFASAKHDINDIKYKQHRLHRGEEIVRYLVASPPCPNRSYP